MIKIKNRSVVGNRREAVDVFRIPVYTFKFKDHDKYKLEWKKFNDEYQEYTDNFLDSVKLSLPNLHKKTMFDPLTNFFRECLNEVVLEISNTGFDIDITSMWSTIQGRGGHHHMHTHRNCMLVGTYYLYSDTPDTTGTMFYNSMSDFKVFRTDGYYGGKTKLDRSFLPSTTWYDNSHHIPFEEGKLVIYPGWMRHAGLPHNGDNRQVIAFNAMPIGRTDDDPTQRYFYTDFRDLVMPYDDK